MQNKIKYFVKTTLKDLQTTELLNRNFWKINKFDLFKTTNQTCKH